MVTYATGVNGPSETVVYRTADGDAEWMPAPLPSSVGECNELDALDPAHVWLVCTASFDGPSTLYSSSDGGATWTTTASNLSVTSVRFITRLTGWAIIEPPGRVAATADAGHVWRLITEPNAPAGELFGGGRFASGVPPSMLVVFAQNNTTFTTWTYQSGAWVERSSDDSGNCGEASSGGLSAPSLQHCSWRETAASSWSVPIWAPTGFRCEPTLSWASPPCHLSARAAGGPS
jgi:photosystem II stability/assembly factor-like uncharacterized protein